MKLHALKFGIATAICWGTGVLMLGLMVKFMNWGAPFLRILSSIYLGYAESLSGIIVGTLWALVDGFCAGFFVAFVYNLLLRKSN